MADFSEWVGRSVTRPDSLTQRLMDEYRAALSPFLFDVEEHVAPPGLHFGLAPATPEADETGRDGAELKGVFLPPIPLSRRMWAGGFIETLRPLRQGARVIRTSVISAIQMKRGSSGELCIISIDHEIADFDGTAIRERQDLVFREPPAGAVPAPGPDQDLRTEWHVEASPLLLFRFSAFTFNGHRIHYDLGYAAEEGYPGLLVHGPLQAALMLNLAADKLGYVPQRFEYRCLAPLYGGARFGVGWDTGALRVLRSDGVTTAEGRVLARGTG
ncbi:MaoC family dehydratase N-terminal domain-containing protein [Aestuariivirga sp.]|uniref:FAS1-like dehydratase domain-containing protein n=1 Tax=Aestuariivirga sp. TaxID=2650926 RepID=UPI0035AD82D7